MNSKDELLFWVWERIQRLEQEKQELVEGLFDISMTQPEKFLMGKQYLETMDELYKAYEIKADMRMELY